MVPRPWRGGRAVECGGLENRCTLAGTEGSNPSLSARTQSALVRNILKMKGFSAPSCPWQSGLVTLAETRERARAARKLLLDGIDPLDAKAAKRRKASLDAVEGRVRCIGVPAIRFHELSVDTGP